MGKLESYLLQQHQGAKLIEESKDKVWSKDDYILNAKEGTILAFRIFFESKSGVKLTKVISGKIITNNKEKEQYIVETKNQLQFEVPYVAVLWLKTGTRWPKGLYNEMKQGATEIDTNIQSDFGGLDEFSEPIEKK